MNYFENTMNNSADWRVQIGRCSEGCIWRGTIIRAKRAGCKVTGMVFPCKNWQFWSPKWLEIFFKFVKSKWQQNIPPVTLQTALFALITVHLQMHPSLHLPIWTIIQCIFKIFLIIVDFSKTVFFSFLNYFSNTNLYISKFPFLSEILHAILPYKVTF